MIASFNVFLWQYLNEFASLPKRLFYYYFRSLLYSQSTIFIQKFKTDNNRFITVFLQIFSNSWIYFNWLFFLFVSTAQESFYSHLALQCRIPGIGRNLLSELITIPTRMLDLVMLGQNNRQPISFKLFVMIYKGRKKLFRNIVKFVIVSQIR